MEEHVRREHKKTVHFVQTKYPVDVFLQVCELLHDKHEDEGTEAPLMISKEDFVKMCKPVLRIPDDEVDPGRMFIFAVMKMNILSLVQRGAERWFVFGS